MKACILAAGLGSRLKELTNDIPKGLLKIDKLDKSILDYLIFNISRNKDDIDEIVILVGKEKEQIINEIGDFYNGIKISYIVNEIYDKTNNSYSLYLAKELLKGNEFILFDGDIVCENKLIKNFIKHINIEKSVSRTYIYEKDRCPEEDMKLYVKDGKAVRFEKAKINEEYDLIAGESIGINFFSKELSKIYFEVYESEFISKDNVNCYYEDVFNYLIEKDIYTTFKYSTFKDYYFTEVDTKEDLDEMNKTVEKISIDKFIPNHLKRYEILDILDEKLDNESFLFSKILGFIPKSVSKLLQIFKIKYSFAVIISFILILLLSAGTLYYEKLTNIHFIYGYIAYLIFDYSLIFYKLVKFDFFYGRYKRLIHRFSDFLFVLGFVYLSNSLFYKDIKLLSLTFASIFIFFFYYYSSIAYLLIVPADIRINNKDRLIKINKNFLWKNGFYFFDRDFLYILFIGLSFLVKQIDMLLIIFLCISIFIWLIQNFFHWKNINRCFK